MIGSIVNHKLFGKGEIIQVNNTSTQYEKYITVKFEMGEKQFVFPNVFENFLTTENDNLKQMVEETIKLIKIEKQKPSVQEIAAARQKSMAIEAARKAHIQTLLESFSKDKLSIERFFVDQMSELYDKIWYITYRRYKKLYNEEEAKYKRSPEYTKAKNKAYWSKSKQERDRAALEQELAKLDCWTARRGPSSGKHISYSKKVDEDSSSDYISAIGFEPSVSESDFYQNESIKITSVTDDKLFLSLADGLRCGRVKWNKYPEFYKWHEFNVKHYLSFTDINEHYLLNFFELKEQIYMAFDIAY